jgi:membrane protein YdbS with pleckstrin-like domain
VAWWTLRALCLVLPVTGALAAAMVVWESSRPWTGPLLVAAAVLGTAYTAAVPSWRYAVHRWETTDQAVYAASGWFVRDWRIAPISRIQTVDTSRGPLEQLMGLATLVVTTASSSGAVYIRGLTPKDATEAAGRLAEITQHTPGDAT